jgi:hypothetical protein
MDKYAEVKALVAGTTSFLLAPVGVDSCYSSVVRTIDTAENGLGVDKIQTSISVPSSTAAQTLCGKFASGATNAYVVHVAEGTDATALGEFTTLSGRASGCLLSPQTTIVHGTALGMTEFQTMAQKGMRLVWSPASNEFLYGATTRIDLALAAGVSVIALAPDWSMGGSINLFDELRTADAVDNSKFGDLLSPQRLFQMVTIDAARALGVDAFVGSLEVGKRADIAVIGGDTADPYGALLKATPLTVQLVLVDGKVLYGDARWMALGSAALCEPLSLCKGDKFLCIAEAPSGNKLDQRFTQITDALTSALAAYDGAQLAGSPPLSPLAPLWRCP